MNPPLQWCVLALAACVIASAGSAAGEGPVISHGEPLPRPRLAEALRAKAEGERQDGSEGAVKMEKVIVREAPLPSGPAKEKPRDGPFSVTEGGYLLKNRGKRISTEVGLWRHIEIIDYSRDQLGQTGGVRMGLLSISW